MDRTFAMMRTSPGDKKNSQETGPVIVFGWQKIHAFTPTVPGSVSITFYRPGIAKEQEEKYTETATKKYSAVTL